MKNREQIAWAFGFDDYANSDIADIVSDMLYAAVGYYLLADERDRFEKWLGLQCDPETNNWGVLEEKKNDSKRISTVT